MGKHAPLADLPPVSNLRDVTMLYVILEKTPYPGNWHPMATCHIQKAEFDLRLGTHYGARATKLKDTLSNDVLLYSWEDAQRIVAYWQEHRDWAQYKVLGYPT